MKRKIVTVGKAKANIMKMGKKMKMKVRNKINRLKKTNLRSRKKYLR